MSAHVSLLKRTGILALCSILFACGGGETSSTTSANERNISAEAQAFYAADPQRYSFKTLADIPEGLQWQSGEGLPDIGSPEAKKGGTQYEFMADFPATLRVNGPDANGEFRRFILDYTSLALAHRHPNEFDFYPAIASQWAVDYDNKTVYARLNPSARFTDGEPITADDFFFTFFRQVQRYIGLNTKFIFFRTCFSILTKFI